MAIQAPRHRERLGLKHQRHQFHIAMTRRTAHALLDVRGVIKKNIAGQIVDAIPCQRPILLPTVAHRLQHRRVAPDLRVAGHASLRRWNAGKRRRLHASVTIPTIQTQSAHVMLVTERDGLIDETILPRDPCRTERKPAGPGRQNKKRQNEDRERFSDRVETGMKELRHDKSADPESVREVV